MTRSWWAFATLFAASLAVSAGALTSQEALPEWATKGKFESRFEFPADMPIMIHASVLPDGKVIFWGRDKVVDGSGETVDDVVGHSKVRIWDPVTEVIETVDNGTTNLFCSGHSLLPDGRLFVTGGHQHAHPGSQVGDRGSQLRLRMETAETCF